MKDPKSKIWLLITVLFAAGLTIFTLSYLVTRPGHVVTALGGDGAKNIFTYLYHSMYGKGYWFEGMNYPYGEHITYTDGQPLLSVLFASMHNVSAETALTALWLLIGLSYVLSVVYLYKILTHFKVLPLIAMIFAGLITVFSPQIFRIGGHYALAYMNIIPMLFYWTIKYNERSQLKYCVYAFLLVTTMSFLHLYFSAVSLIWMSCYSAAYFITSKARPVARLKHIIPAMLSIIAAFGILAVVMKLTDPMTDRPAVPYGILDYTTKGKEILTSTYSPIWAFIKDHHIFTHISDGGEGYTYLGLAVIIAVISSLVVYLINRRKKKEQAAIIANGGFAPVWLWTAFIALLFSMGVPYVWHMEWLLNYISFMRQFRTLGRFSWIFYYIVTVYGVVVIYTWYMRLLAEQKIAKGYAVLLIFMLVWIYEASGYIKYSRNVASASPYNYDMLFSKQEQNWESFLQEHKYKKEDFQGLLLLPYFNVGTEKLWIDAGWVLTLGAKASIQLRLPIVDIMMSRSSWSVAEKQVKIAAGPYAEKPMLNDLKSDKPLLLLHFEEDSLNADQKDLLRAADYIGHFSQSNVYAFYPKRLLANNKAKADSINQILPLMHGQDTCTAAAGEWYVNHLDDMHAADHFFGAGAAPHILGKDSIIAEIPVRPTKDNEAYEFSCWFLLTKKDYRSPCIYFQTLDSAGNVLSSPDLNTKWSVDNDGMWFRASTWFKLSANCRSIKCKVSNEPYPTYEVMDEIVLRPVDAVIISKANDGGVMVNNHVFKKRK